MDVKLGDTTLPQEHEDQMKLGLRVITTAFENKMLSLEKQIRGLRQTSEEQRNNVSGLQKKNSALEVELVECHQRAQQMAEENKELFKTVQSLRKQIGRLECLKQAVLSSIQDDQAHEAELGDSKILMSDEFLRGATPLTSLEFGLHGGQASLSRSASSPPQALPAMNPIKEHVAHRGEQRGVGLEATLEGLGHSPMGPMVGGAAIGSAPPAAGSPVIDGKQFFKQARSRLSYEAFNLFLASIKRLNNQQQTREETLEEARRIFGPELQDLYRDFETLLNRNHMLG